MPCLRRPSDGGGPRHEVSERAQLRSCRQRLLQSADGKPERKVHRGRPGHGRRPAPFSGKRRIRPPAGCAVPAAPVSDRRPGRPFPAGCRLRRGLLHTGGRRCPPGCRTAEAGCRDGHLQGRHPLRRGQGPLRPLCDRQQLPPSRCGRRCRSDPVPFRPRSGGNRVVDNL